MEKLNEANPEYLYHYTDVDTLALILSNRTIRFNSLVNMDDKQEQMSQSNQNFGRFVFVSSWTNNEKESIPMWRMYTTKGRGVRIKLPVNPFRVYEYTKRQHRNKHNLSPLLSFGDESVPHRFIIPDTELFGNDYHLFNFPVNNQLLKVEYVDDPDLLQPELFKIVGSSGNINMGILGRFKNTYWAFQSEWRYKLDFFPFNIKELSELSEVDVRKSNTKLLEELNGGMDSKPFEY